jgi:glycerol uptake facilitator-like aquaporin
MQFKTKSQKIYCLNNKVPLVWAVSYIVSQLLGAISGVRLVKAFSKACYIRYEGDANTLSDREYDHRFPFRIKWIVSISWSGYKVDAFPDVHDFIYNVNTLLNALILNPDHEISTINFI